MAAVKKEEEVKLLGAVSGVSPYVIRAQMALAVKGVAGYDYLPENLARKSDLLLASNPVHKQVPVLIHRGRPICDSSVIVHYVDEAFSTGNNGASSILPADPYDRAVARFWAAYIDDKLFPTCLGILKAPAAGPERAEKVQETLAALRLVEGAFVDCSKGKAFFGGDSVRYLDIALGCYLCWFDGVGYLAGVALLDPATTPRLAAWAERFRAQEPVKALVPGVDKVEAYVNTVLYPKWSTAAVSSQ